MNHFGFRILGLILAVCGLFLKYLNFFEKKCNKGGGDGALSSRSGVKIQNTEFRRFSIYLGKCCFLGKFVVIWWYVILGDLENDE